MFKRVIALLLALVLACGMCLSAVAESGCMEISMRTIYNHTNRNNTTVSDKYLSSKVRVSYSSSVPYFDTLEEGMEYLCQRMKARASEVNFVVRNLDEFTSFTEQERYDFVLQNFYDSMRHTGDPKGGDYIKGQWHKLSYGFGIRSDGIQFVYQFAYYANAEQEAEVDAKIKEVLDELDVYNSTDYEKSNAVYDYLCENITYDYANLNDEEYILKYSAYAGLINGTCVCNGYAVLYYRMMLELGVDARYITGIGGGGLHAWNIVMLDGVYYNLDATWDAGATNYAYYLKNNSLFVGHTRDAVYNSSEFNAIYPMSPSVYSNSTKDNVDYENGFTYRLINNGKEYMLVSVSGLKTANLVIPETFNDKPVTAIGNHVLLNNDNVTKITIPESVTSIGEYAFSGCKNLKTISYYGKEADWTTLSKADTWVYGYPMPNYTVEFVSVVVFGDINGDGKFSYQDISKLYAIYREVVSAPWGVNLDINGDGRFSYVDVSKLYALYREL